MRNLSTAHSRRWVTAASVFALTLLVPGAGFAAGGSEWASAGGNRQNTRFQESEHTLSVANVGGLQVKWELETASDVSATPAVDADTVYAPDWAGNLYAVDRQTGADQVDGEHSGCQRFVHGQGANHASGDRRQGDRRHPGRHPLRGRPRRRRCSRSTSSPVRSSGAPASTRTSPRSSRSHRRCSTARSTSAWRLRRRRWRRSCPATCCRSGAACSLSTSRQARSSGRR